MSIIESKTGKVIVDRVSESRIKEVDIKNVSFGKHFSDHIACIDYAEGAWHRPRIQPYGYIPTSPAISAIHYGQAIFEGMKAYRNKDGKVVLFRPLDNHKRLNISASRLCMPEIPQDLFMDMLVELMKIDNEWVLPGEQNSLYIRPVYFATDEFIGVRESLTYRLIILTCPVSIYYTDPIKVMVANNFVRAYQGGVGFAKVAGNYANSLLATREAKALGYTNVLWMDAETRKNIEESGTMNVFFVIDGKVVTPRLTGTILAGITRDSVITLLKDANIPVEERDISIDEIAQTYKDGKLQEVFGTGTAVGIAPIIAIGHEGKDMNLPPMDSWKIAPTLMKQLKDIRFGNIPDKFSWIYPVE